MKILLFKKTTDADLSIKQQVCYKDQQGEYTKIGIITDCITIRGIKHYLINTSFGTYTADELKLIKNEE